MPKVATSAGAINYSVTGAPGAFGPIVLLHGMGMASSSYADVIPGLAAAAQVYAFDTPGHGESETPAGNDPFPVEKIADTMIEAFGVLGLERINVVGNSLGAMTAIEIAATAPHRIRKIVLVGCPGWDGRQRMDRQAARRNAPPPDPNAPVTKASLAPQFTAPDDVLVERVALARQQSQAFIERAGGAVMSHDTLGRAFAVKAPTLLLCGERDIVIPDQPKFMKAIPDVRMSLFENAGHYPQVDNPTRFVNTVLEFLR